MASTSRAAPAVPLSRALFGTCAVLVALAVSAACRSDAAQGCQPLGEPDAGAAYLLPGTRAGMPYTRDGAVTLRYDSFRHADQQVRPTAVILRGGSTTVGARTSFVGQFVETFAEAGYQVVLPDYRTSSSRHDLVALLRTLQCHGDALGIDPYRVVFVAEDSAAHAALDTTRWLARLRRGRSAAQPSPPRATVVLGGRYEASADPIEDPTLLVHGDADRELPIEVAHARCAAAAPDTPCDVMVVPGGIHRAQSWTPPQWDYKRRMLDWLVGRLGETPPAPSWPTDSRLSKRVLFDAAHGLTLDAFVPHGAGPRPAVILVHGGGWEAGDRVTYVTPLFTPLARAEVAWFSIDYRLTPAVTVDAQLDDVRTAIEYVRQHAARFRIDASRIVLVGESASGHLVSQLAAEGVDVAGVVSFYGVYDLEAMAGDPVSPRSLARRLLGVTTMNDDARTSLRRVSPLHHVHEGMPPLLLVTGTGDGLWKQAQSFTEQLRSVGARFDTVVLPDAPHGMEQWDADPRWRDWDTRVVDWIRRVTSRDDRHPRVSSRP